MELHHSREDRYSTLFQLMLGTRHGDLGSSWYGSYPVPRSDAWKLSETQRESSKPKSINPVDGSEKQSVFMFNRTRRESQATVYFIRNNIYIKAAHVYACELIFRERSLRAL